MIKPFRNNLFITAILKNTETIIQSTKTMIMKSNFKQMTAVAAVLLLGNAVMAQVNVSNTVNATTKTTANVSHVTNAVSKTTDATTKVVQNTGQVVQNTTSATGKVVQNVNVSTNATTNASANSKLNAQTNAGVNADVKKNPADPENSKSADVKEMVVTEAKDIRTTDKELRKDVKPRLSISSNTNGSTHSELKEGNASVTGQTNSNTEAKVKSAEMKEKAKEIKTEATQKTKAAVKKTSDAKADAKIKASANSSTTVETKH